MSNQPAAGAAPALADPKRWPAGRRFRRSRLRYLLDEREIPPVMVAALLSIALNVGFFWELYRARPVIFLPEPEPISVQIGDPDLSDAALFDVAQPEPEPAPAPALESAAEAVVAPAPAPASDATAAVVVVPPPPSPAPPAVAPPPPTPAPSEVPSPVALMPAAEVELTELPVDLGDSLAVDLLPIAPPEVADQAAPPSQDSTPTDAPRDRPVPATALTPLRVRPELSALPSFELSVADAPVEPLPPIAQLPTVDNALSREPIETTRPTVESVPVAPVAPVVTATLPPRDRRKPLIDRTIVEPDSPALIEPAAPRVVATPRSAREKPLTVPIAEPVAAPAPVRERPEIALKPLPALPESRSRPAVAAAERTALPTIKRDTTTSALTPPAAITAPTQAEAAASDLANTAAAPASPALASPGPGRVAQDDFSLGPGQSGLPTGSSLSNQIAGAARDQVGEDAAKRRASQNPWNRDQQFFADDPPSRIGQLVRDDPNLTKAVVDYLVSILVGGLAQSPRRSYTVGPDPGPLITLWLEQHHGNLELACRRSAADMPAAAREVLCAPPKLPDMPGEGP